MLLINSFMQVVTNTPLFGIGFSILAYYIGYLIYNKTKIFLLSPFLIGFVLVITTIVVFDIPYDNFAQGGDIIMMFIAPTTVCLAYTMYLQLKILKLYLWPILIGTFVGALVSVVSTYFLAHWFGINDQFILSMLPKSSTTAIAMEISAKSGGIMGITIAAVMLTGLLGSTLNPVLVKLLNINDPVAVGVGMGTSAHGLGTSRAYDLGEIQGAMSGLAMTLTGFFIVIIMLFFQG